MLLYKKQLKYILYKKQLKKEIKYEIFKLFNIIIVNL